MPRIIATIALLVLASCKPLQAAPKQTPKEPTFWRLCWDAAGAPVFASEDPSEAQRCRNLKQKPKPLRWHRLPIRVRVESNAGKTRSALRHAIGRWNYWAGRTIFVETHMGADVTIVVNRCLFQPNLRAMAPTRRESGRLGGLVYVCTRILGDDDMSMTMAHELGHILGFAHDPDTPSSLMYPRNTPFRKGLTKTDLRALRRRYGKR